MDGYLHEFRARLRLIRVRRARLESALSWCRPMSMCYSANWSAGQRMARIRGYYNFAPTLGYPVLNALEPVSLWARMTAAGRAMWYHDEVEARWQGLAAGACAEKGPPGLEGEARPRCMEVTWSKYRVDPEAAEELAAGAGRCPVRILSFAETVAEVAAFMGLSPARRGIHDSKSHTHSGVAIGGTAPETLPQMVAQHGTYMAIMRFNRSMLELLRPQLACL